MNVSVIVPVYRDWERLELCLAALLAQTSPCFEIIVVANDGRRLPRAMEDERVRLLEEARPGSYAARNAAVASARGQVLAFTDADCIPEPDWLRQALRALRENPGSRVTGPVPIFQVDGANRLAWLHDSFFAFDGPEDAARGICPTANLIVPKCAFDRVGPFDSSLFSGGDVEWSKRATSAGVPLIFDPDVRVSHPARQSVRELVSRRRRIAGAHPFNPDIQFLSYVRHGLRPPLRALARLPGRDALRFRDRAALFLLLWLLNLAGLVEYLLLVSRLKRPNRA